MIHFDPWWNVAAQNQATDRAHRIGQKNQVVVFRLIAQNTIEEKILHLQEKKQEMASQILSRRGHFRDGDDERRAAGDSGGRVEETVCAEIQVADAWKIFYNSTWLWISQGWTRLWEEKMTD